MSKEAKKNQGDQLEGFFNNPEGVLESKWQQCE